MAISVILMLVISFGSMFATILAGWHPKLGLDLAGGTEVVLTPQHGRSISAGQLAVSETIIRNRVAGIGVSGVTVQTETGNPPQIIVQIPGVENGRTLDQEISKTAQLLLRPVECFTYPFEKPPKTKPTTKDPHPVQPKVGNPLSIPACNPELTLQSTNKDFSVTPEPNSVAGYTVSPGIADPQFIYTPSITVKVGTAKAGKEALVDKVPGVAALPVIEEGLPGQSAPAVEVSSSGQEQQIANARYVLAPAVMTGTSIGSASAAQTETGEFVVNLTLTSKGSSEWDYYSNKYFHTYIAVDLDGIVQSAPLIQPTQNAWSSFQGQVQISGNFTQGQANALATVLEYGSLPVPLQILTSESVSPTLGHAALVAGLGAGLAGLALVMLYVIIYYRLLGLVVLVGLGVTGALLWAIISALGQTSVAPSFDLAGVTGLIVSIGITVDSYIVYFERLKDETRSGRSVRTSLDRGFASAWRTVLAADTVSLLAAVLLFFLAAGSVQGFAFFLGLSTLLDIVVTWFFTRPAVYLLGSNEKLTAMRGLGIAKGLGATPRVAAPTPVAGAPA
jgi:preprotein translocase subunit SecD